MSVLITEVWRQFERKDKLAQTLEALGSMHPLVPTASLPQIIKPLTARASRLFCLPDLSHSVTIWGLEKGCQQTSAPHQNCGTTEKKDGEGARG